MDKNAGSVFEQRNALARQRAHLRDEVRNRAGRAAREWLKRLSDLTVFPKHSRYSERIKRTKKAAKAAFFYLRG
ncbi:hypothetical protein [Pantoea agglomerans]|uniref:hypothetical protein n=1 Tax=Enterobacter agglomerans TaxID=549 RepID=UPI003DA08F9F